MKAALLLEPKRIEIREIARPAPGPHQVLVSVKSCGVCATDVKKYAGDSKAPHLPFVLGHEPAGVIESTGPDTHASLQPGMRVAIAPVLTCGHCYACRTGMTLSAGMGMCSDYQVLGFSMDGAFAEYVAVPEANVRPIPPELSFADAALIEPVAACANGVLRANLRRPGTAVVIGAGFMGLVVIQLLKLLGNEVAAIELMEQRRELARKLGANACIDPASEDAGVAVERLTGGRGADAIICAVGGQAITEKALAILGKGGTLVLMASAKHGVKFQVDLSKAHYDQSVITGSVSYTGPSYEWAMELLTKKALDIPSLVSDVGPLESTGRFLEMTRTLEGMKKVVVI